MRVVNFLRDVARRSPGSVGLAASLLVVAGMIDMAALLSMAPLVDFVLQGGEGAPSELTRRMALWLRAVGVVPSTAAFLTVFLVLNAAKAGIQSLSVYVIVRTRYGLLRDLMRGTFSDCLSARWEFFTSREQGTMLNLFVRDFTAVGDAFGALARFGSGVIQLAMCALVPLYVSWQLTGLSLVAAALLIWPFVALGRVSYRLGRQSGDAATALTTVFQESFGAAKVVLACWNQAPALARFERAFDAHQRNFLRAQTLSRSIPAIYYPLGLTVVVLTLVVSQRLSVPLSETAVILYSLLRVFSVIGPIAEEKHVIDALFANYERILDFRRAAQEARQPTGSRRFEGLARDITFEGVSFAHPGRPPVLVDVNARVPKGAFVAFVGESGAGKSTLVDLLVGLYAPGAGRITIDGVDLSEFDVASYRKRIGYVPQDSLLFNTSIRDNIRWAREDATDEEIASACRMANAMEFIDGLPEGYATVVGDRGVRLSGGQVQRIALARAILRNPAILILDEATSALDSFSERLIQQSIEQIAHNTTVIVIAHRLSTVANADQIYVMSDGRIVESGSYSALVSGNGIFSRMVGVQSLEAGQ